MKSALRCFNRMLVAVCGLALLAGCAPGRNLPVLPAFNGKIYHLGVDDQVRIITYGADQLSDTFRVDDAGDIGLPLLGNVPAVGLTTHQLAVKLMAELKAKNLLREPSVTVEVVSYRSLFILGEVTKPGQYPYEPGMSMLSAVAIAGGYTYRAWRDYVEVVRSDGTDTATGRALPQAFVAPGDVITVFERPW